MPGRRWLWGFGGKGRLATAGAIALAATLVACRGDTLYDAPTKPSTQENAPPPTVNVTLPAPGLQVLAGRSVRVQVVASDTLGVNQLDVQIRGAATATITRRYDPPRTSVTLDTLVVIPAGANGRVEVVATAHNILGGTATTAARSVSVSGVDATAPTVSVTATVPARMELTDRVHLHITAADNEAGSGLARVGATVLALVGSKPDTLVMTAAPKSFSPAATGTVTYDVDAAPPTNRALPAILSVQVYAFAVDSAGNCSAATTTSANQACRTVTLGGNAQTVAETPAAPQPTTLVAGRSTALPSGTVIADMVPDANRGLLYFSNFTNSRVEVMNVANGTLASPVLVGAEPWGLAFNRASDTLIVANSGGTNISYIPLGSSAPTEALTQRIRTQNADLYQITFSVIDTVFDNGVRDTAFVSMTITLGHYSDRPQFIAQDNTGRLVYSTRPAGREVAGPGTMRVIERQPGWQVPETRLAVGVLEMGPDTLLPSFEPDTFAIINIDSLRKSTTRCLTVYDHLPGTETPISAAACDATALASLQDVFSLLKGKGSDIRIFRYNTQLLTFADTSFVAASADHRYLAFAQGATAGGRLIMWNGDAASFSNGIEIADILDNTSDHLIGLDLNQNGTLGAARGLKGAYYFTNDLRLQGSRAVATAGPAGGGVAIDPRNTGLGVYGQFPAYNGTQLSYVPTANHSIKIFDTVNFAERGEILIRDNIVGPLKASPPLAGESGVVTKLYGATDGGAVVVVNVATTDIH